TLICNRYDLEAGSWNAAASPLDLPSATGTFTARLKETPEATPPHLGIWLPDGTIYARSLGSNGDEWEREDFRKMIPGFGASGLNYGTRFAVAGDFDGDGRAEVAIAPDINFYVRDPFQSRGNDFWVMDYDVDSAKWRHLSPIARHGMGADFDCSDQGYAARFAVTGDFDGDGRDEVAVAPDLAPGDSSGAENDFWVMDYDPDTGQFGHLYKPGQRPKAGQPDIGADFSCDATVDLAAFAVAGDFNHDGRDEIAIARDAPGTTGNDLWVMAYDPTLGWTPLASIDASAAAYPAQFAVAADFDGDHIEEIAIAPRAGQTSEGNDLWVMKYDSNRKDWGHLPSGSIVGNPLGADVDCSASPYQAACLVAGDFDGDGQVELAVAADDPTPPGGRGYFWVMRYDKQVGPNGAWTHLSPLPGGHPHDADFEYPTDVAARFAAVGDFDGDGRDEIFIRAAVYLKTEARYVMDYDPVGKTWKTMDALIPLTLTGFDLDTNAIVAGNFDGDHQDEILLNPVYAPTPKRAETRRTNAMWPMDFDRVPAAWQAGCTVARAKPSYAGPFDVTERYTSDELQARRTSMQQIVAANAGLPAENLIYFDEAWYFVPLQIALQLQQAGQYTAALDWYRTIYDFREAEADRKIYYGLLTEESLPNGFQQPADWLRDPLNPHRIASTRRNAYTRYTLMAIVRCFLEFGDAEFTRDTAESVPRARTLYLTARGLLDLPEMKQDLSNCQGVIRSLNATVRNAIVATDRRWIPAWNALTRDLSRIAGRAILESAVASVASALAARGGWDTRFANARGIVAGALSASSTAPSLTSVLRGRTEMLGKWYLALLGHAGVAEAMQRVGAVAGQDLLRSVATIAGIAPDQLANNGRELPWLRSAATTVAARSGGSTSSPLTSPRVGHDVGGYMPSPPTFCIPPNAVLRALRLHEELNLYKLRSCRNIAGMRRELEPYAAPTDGATGMPAIGGGGQLVLPGTVTVQPTQYRYSVLIERAKQLASLAQQIEAAYLSALEKRDSEYYNLLKARQDVRLAYAGVRLQALRVTEARDGVTLAQFQHERAQTQADHYQELLDQGINDFERLGLAFQETAVLFSLTAAAFSVGAGTIQAAEATVELGASGGTVGWGDLASSLSSLASASSSMASAASSQAAVFSTLASYERRKEEWGFQKSLAEEDVKIGAQQVKIADDHVRVAGQERAIAEMQAEHAEAVADFLANKFTNVELYDWMT
ncbi:MAG TPA: FG-GAP-like repeat-containing protein, partial [Gemmatimonadaceae bacterium]|nr:FG-GAP-like repeat-containing protein [Gemmatimonadaceae bacterium]